MVGNELLPKRAHIPPCADCRILLEMAVRSETALLDFQNPAEFTCLVVGKRNVDLKIEQTESRSH